MFPMDLIQDPHLNLDPPHLDSMILVKGSYAYYHYACDGFNDAGWGCGYRTLQTICSFIKCQQESLGDNAKAVVPVPSILEIQKVLVDIGDKKDSFVGSREWIGSVEVSYAIDYFYEVPSRLIHARDLNELKEKSGEIIKHFEEFGSPIMMGGDQDCSSKCILGLGVLGNDIWLLILDPHFRGKTETAKKLQENGWIKWLPIDSLMHSSFYNLCCPLIKSK